MIIPSVLLFIDNSYSYNKVISIPYHMEKEVWASLISDSIRHAGPIEVAKSVENKKELLWIIDLANCIRILPL